MKMEISKQDFASQEHMIVQFVSESNEVPFSSFSIGKDISPAKLTAIIHALFKAKNNDDGESDDDFERPYSFFVNDNEIKSTLAECIEHQLIDYEKTLPIVFKPQAVFRVKPVSRCTSSMPGHTQPVIVAQFSPDGKNLASGSGDATLRFWDISTETPHYECRGHRQWILALSWAPDGSKVAVGDKSGWIMLWDPLTGHQIGRTLVAHKQWITAISWQPLHLTYNDGVCRRMASSSKDGDVRIWDTLLCQCIMSLTSHTQSVTCLRWGGTDLLYSASQDRTIKVWRSKDGALCRTLQGHGHWVNVVALNTDYVMRTGSFDPSKYGKVVTPALSSDTAKIAALKRYATFTTELLVSGSDDFTLFMWNPSTQTKPLSRMIGHQQLVNDVKFSPDGRWIASASFDKSVRLWNGANGRFVATFRGHVQAVHQLAWSADSRLLVSASADSTLKLWNVDAKTLSADLPGHADDVYAVDWSPDGQRVVSGGKDTVLRIWKK